jgi:hypothetical protein
MSQLVKMIFICSGISLLLYFTGLMGDNPTLIDLLAPESMNLTLTASFILTAIVSSGFGIAIGFFTKNIELAVATAVLGVIINMVSGFINVYNVMASAGGIGGVMAMLIFSPLLYTTILYSLEWWRGQ